MDLVPPIEDDSGYRVRRADLTFLEISEDSVNWLRERLALLGMTPATYGRFESTLRDALDREGLEDCDVRARGSSSQFFSGMHKKLPFTRDDLYDAHVDERGEGPSNVHLNTYERTLNLQWPSTDPRPLRRPFDSFYRIGLSDDPSDYDLQVRSDEVQRRVNAKVAELGVRPSKARVEHPDYAFFRKYLIEEVCPYLTAWAVEQTHELDRPVTIAAFSSSGPTTSNDWIVL